MAKFVPKASEVEAEQFDLSKSKAVRVAVPVGGRTVVKARLRNGDLIGDGDYLVQSRDGKDVYVVDKADFEALYKPKK